MGCGIRPAPLTVANVFCPTAFQQKPRTVCHSVLDVRCGLAQMAQHMTLNLAKGNDARELTGPCNRIQRGVVGTIRSEQEPQSLEPRGGQN